MSFGLKNATGFFNDFITQQVLAGFIGFFVRSYLDDFIIYSRTWEEHLFHLSLVFERLRIFQLTCALKKCHFGHDNLDYLGYHITSKGVEAKPEHVRAILEAPAPRNRKDLRKFFGTCEWLREYVPQFAQLALPLTAFLSPRCAWRWTDAEQCAFSEIKQAFSVPLELHRPDPSKPFVLQTDACATGMGAALYQIGDRGERHVIAFASAKFTKAGKWYHSKEQECLAIIWAIRRFSRYLEDGKFTIRTDNRALTWLDSIKDGKGKLYRWAMYLRSFDFSVEHVPGKNNELPDALSREPGDAIYAEDPDLPDALLPPEKPVHQQHAHYASALVQDLRAQIAEAQNEQEIDRRDIARFLQPGQELKFLNNAFYVIEHGREARIYVPHACRENVFKYYHTDPLAGHPGVDETLRAIRERHFWPRMREDVRRLVGTCRTCQLTKASKPLSKGERRPRQPFTPWDTVAVDLMGPYTRTPRGKRYVLVATDTMSRWTEAFATTNAEIATIAPILEHEVFMRWGYPRVILTDNAPQFRGPAWKRRCRAWGALSHTSPAYHPQANPTERRNQELKKGLRLRLFERTQRDWDLQLPATLFNTRRRVNVNTGQAPSYMLLGRILPRPGEWNLSYNDMVQERVDEARQLQPSPAQNDNAKGLQVGDLVRARNFAQSNAVDGFTASLATRWVGPFTVRERCSPDVYILARPGQEDIKLHIKDLQRFQHSADTTVRSQQKEPAHTTQSETADADRDVQPPQPVRAHSPSRMQASLLPQPVRALEPVQQQEDASPLPDQADDPYLHNGEDPGWTAEITTPSSQGLADDVNGLPSAPSPRKRGRPTKAAAAARRTTRRAAAPRQTRYFLRTRTPVDYADNK